MKVYLKIPTLKPMALLFENFNSNLVILILLMFTSVVLAQRPYQEISLCPNHNDFLLDDRIDSIMPYISRVMGTGALLLNPDMEDSMDIIFEKMELDAETTFGFDVEIESLGDSLMLYRRYQQYYDDVVVDGGGFTFAYIEPGGPGPCAVDYPAMMVPYIKNNIDVSTSPTILKSSLDDTLGVESIVDAELIITHNLLMDCDYTLVWKTFFKDSIGKVAFIDAISGIILEVVESDPTFNIDAPTVDYMTQEIDCLDDAGTFYLESPDHRIKVYDFNINDDPPTSIEGPEHWDPLVIPSTTEDIWTNESLPEVYQLFFSASKVLPLFENHLDSEFEKTYFGSYQDFYNATSYTRVSSKSNSFYMFGRTPNTLTPLVQIDVVAHEIGHSYINTHKNFSSIIGSTPRGNRTIHEAVSDIIGNFIESKHQNSIDWIMGDDNEDVEASSDRNLADPKWDCFTDVVHFDDTHDRGVPLGHWFYLISTGGTNIPDLGIDKAMLIVDDALAILPTASDYREFMLATLTVIEERYGICSEEFLSVANAWEAICVPTGYPKTAGVVIGCNYYIDGPYLMCEEDNGDNYCIQGGTITPFYEFTIIGRKSTSFTTYCGMVGNSQSGCSCLDITSIPVYPYYPQYITIEAYLPALGSQYVQRKRVKIADCNDDKLSCVEYYDLAGFSSPSKNGSKNDDNNDQAIANSSIDALDNNQTISYTQNYRLFDLTGRLILSGIDFDADKINMPINELMIVAIIDQSGKIVGVNKVILFD